MGNRNELSKSIWDYCVLGGKLVAKEDLVEEVETLPKEMCVPKDSTTNPTTKA